MMSGFAWLPDSTGIVYSSSRGGTMPYLPTLGLWQVTLRDGSVRRVTSGETSYVSPDISKSGAILVGRMKLQTDIWKFPVDGPPGRERAPRRSCDATDRAGPHTHGRPRRQRGRVSLRQRRSRQPVGREHREWRAAPDHSRARSERGRGRPGVVARWPRHRVRLLARQPGVDVWRLAGGSGWKQPAQRREPRSRPCVVAGRPLGVLLDAGRRGSDHDVVLKKVPVDGGPAVTVTTERLRNVIGLDGTTLYYSFERPLVDGTPEFEIRAATPEDAPFRVLARIPASRVPIWQIVNPALSPDGKWLAQALTDGLTTNIWALSTTTGEWRQITDFGERATFIARRVSWSSDGRSILAAVAEGDSDIVLLEGLTNVGRE